MAGTALTTAQAKKLDGLLGTLNGKVGAKDDKAKANLKRFADKYLRFKLGVRGTGPHSHGFDADQRKLITVTVNEAFGIKAPARKAPAGKKATPAKGKATRKRGGKAPSTAQLAKQQQARAQGTPAA